jgi:protein ImuA
MRRAPGNQRPKKGSAARSSRPPGRAAERAGLKPGDLVTELDGTPVRDAADLQLRLALLRIGEVAEFAVSRPGGAATGFATALALLALREGRQAVWIRSDFAAAEAGELYGPGLALMGLSLRRLIVLRVPRPRDALWAMEEALQCRAAGAVVTELMGDDGDLTATRRLALGAGTGGGIGLILRPRSAPTQ